MTDKTVSLELCKLAILKAGKGKRHRRSCRKILRNINFYADRLRNILLNDSYAPSSYKPLLIVDKPSGKERLLQKPRFFPDQCVHHAAIMLAEDKLLKHLDPYAIGSVPGRGSIYGHRAIRRWLKDDRVGTKYCAKGDIRHCYESIKPQYIVAAFSRIFKDKKYLSLITKIAYSYSSLPLGNYTSTWFANVLLLIIDKTARSHHAVTHYLRYIDDFILFGPNKRKLHRAMNEIRENVKTVGLEVKGNWQVFPVDSRAVDILGYRYFRNTTILRKRNALALSRQARKIRKKIILHKKISVRCAAGFLSRLGQLKHCQAGNLNKNFKGIKIKTIKDVVRNERKNSNLSTARRINLPRQLRHVHSDVL